MKTLSKKECSKAGLRFSRKRKYCYLKCRSKVRKFSAEQFKCLKEEEIKAAAEKAAAERAAAERVAEEKAAAKKVAAEKAAAEKTASEKAAAEVKAEAEEIKLDKKACKDAGRRFSRRRGCTEKCRNKLHAFNNEKASCLAKKVIEIVEEKVEEIVKPVEKPP